MSLERQAGTRDVGRLGGVITEAINFGGYLVLTDPDGYHVVKHRGITTDTRDRQAR